MAGIRTFIAVDVPEDVKERIGELQDELRRFPGRLTWTRAQGIHVTLKFLGNVPPEQIDAIEAAVRRAASGKPKPHLRVAGTGAFPSWRRPRVLWVGLEDMDGVLGLVQKAVEEELGRLGFEPEGRAFTPHLTLARVKVAASVGEIVRRLRGREFDAGEFDVEEVLVMRSDLKPSGAEYTPLRRVPIG